MATVGSQCVTVRADAAEGSRHVMAAESALMPHLLALVDILADLQRSRSEALVAVALEAALNVRTGAVAANVGNGAFVVVYKTTDLENNVLMFERLDFIPTHLWPLLSKT